MKKRDFAGVILLVIVILIFFRATFSLTRLPIPTDLLVNLFNPYRDFYSLTYPRGVPFKNPLVGDPVLQQIPGRKLSIELLKKFEIPLWNPYQMAGYPLMGNIQSASFYPLNILFFILPFLPAWVLLIISQQVIGAITMYYYLRSKKLSLQASMLGGLAFSFSGFFIAWLEWGTIASTAAWIPLGLLAIDRLLSTKKVLWTIVLFFALSCSLLAGHLQTFIYGAGLLMIYFLLRWWNSFKDRKSFFLSIGGFITTGIITFPIWYNQLQLILLSARNVDLSWQKLGWFIPLAQIIQFFAPDFFGNPATGNYWGVFNYGEFIGYVGIAPLILALIALVLVRKKEVMFWGSVVLGVMLFATQNPLAELPYRFGIPFFSATQPTRLLVLADIGLAILAAIGYDRLFKSSKDRNILPISLVVGLVAGSALIFYFMSAGSFAVQDFAVTKRNLIVPVFLMVITSFFLFMSTVISQKKRQFLLPVIIGITTVDLLFFAGKYTPFANKDFFYPMTKSLSFLLKQKGEFRFMTTTRQIFSPNIATYYHLQSIDGYDPLYLMRYGELMAASERGRPDISPPFGFNRIVVSNQISSPVIDLLGVKYILSLTERTDTKLKKVFQEGETRIYENTRALPRTFFVAEVEQVQSKKDAIDFLFNPANDLRKVAVIEQTNLQTKHFGSGSAHIVEYSANNVKIKTKTSDKAFLVLTDTFYPTWQVTIDGKLSKILLTDYHFRGVVVPRGDHTVEFSNKLF